METRAFRIQNLLTRKDGKISAPMSPMLFANEVMAQAEMKFNRLARVWFEDETILQQKEDGGLTGFDTLIVAKVYEDDLFLSLWVDMGVSGLPVAIAFQSDFKVDNKVDISSPYTAARFARKLSEKEITEIFTYIIENPHVLDIEEETP